MARKVHYTCDLFFALSWGLITGFNSPFPWFYPCFFAVMVIHRASRDIRRCRERYGEAWFEYERRVPYLFIPVSFHLYLSFAICHGADLLVRCLSVTRMVIGSEQG